MNALPFRIEIAESTLCSLPFCTASICSATQAGSCHETCGNLSPEQKSIGHGFWAIGDALPSKTGRGIHLPAEPESCPDARGARVPLLASGPALSARELLCSGGQRHLTRPAVNRCWNASGGACHHHTDLCILPHRSRTAWRKRRHLQAAPRGGP